MLVIFCSRRFVMLDPLTKMADILQKLYEEYKNAVSQNSAAIGQFESAFRLISYLIAGRFEDSTILSELLYSASNLLVLFNDAIIQKASGILPKVTTSKSRLQSLVTVLEYVGVFIEMSACRLYGERGRWIAITVLQIAKCVCRFLLLVKHEVGIQATPPLTPIDREAILKEKEKKQEEVNGHGVQTEPSVQPQVLFTLKRSGKVMRTLTTGGSVKTRDWKLPTVSSSGKMTAKRINDKPSNLSRSQVWGEILYIVKPLIHLSSMYAFGTSSFKSWLLSSSLDIGSLCMIGDNQKLNTEEQAELRRRSLMLALYLLRSPFYDRYTKAKLIAFLRALSDTVPGLSILLGPLMEYLPVWQQIYFYTWST